MFKFWLLKLLKDKKEAELTLYGDISNTSWYGDEVTPKQFSDDIEALGDVETINVRINSYGGDVFAGVAIYNILKSHSAKIVVYIDGIAASAASLIAMAGDEVIMPSNSIMMVHNPWTIAMGDSGEMRKVADKLDKIGESILTSYQLKTKLSVEKLIELFDQETYLSAEEAVELGFADKIGSEDIKMSLDSENIHIGSVKMSLKQWSILSNNKNKSYKSKDNINIERVIDMNIKQLCEKVGLDYDLLVNSGLNDDQIKAMALQIQLKNIESSKTDAPKTNSEGQEVQVSVIDPKQEKLRTTEIVNLCTGFKLDTEKMNEFLLSDKNIDQVRNEVLELLKINNSPTPAAASANISFGEDERDKFRNAASDAILMRGNIKPTVVAEGASDFRSMKLREIAIVCCERMGINNARYLSDNDLFRMSLSPDSAFTGILSDSVNKSMANAYEVAPTTYQRWCGTNSNKDFKAASRYQLSEAGELEEIHQNGEVKFDEMSDSSVTTQILQFGKAWGFTRKNLINDDLQMLTLVPQRYVLSALMGRNKLVYAKLKATTNIYDGTPLFHADHANLAGSGSAINSTSVGAGEVAMAAQKGARGLQTLNIRPSFLICSPAKKNEALTLVKSISDPAASNSNVANIYKDSFEVISDGELTGNAWYLAAMARLIDTIIVSYLNGNEQPILEMAVGDAANGYLGVKYRIIDEFGVDIGDYKGLYKNPGN